MASWRLATSKSLELGRHATMLSLLLRRRASGHAISGQRPWNNGTRVLAPMTDAVGNSLVVNCARLGSLAG